MCAEAFRSNGSTDQVTRLGRRRHANDRPISSHAATILNSGRVRFRSACRQLTLRSLRWPDDREALLALDTSFTTERVYRVVATAVAFAIHDTAITPPLHKVYDLTAEVDRFPKLDHVLIAEIDGHLAGVAALSYEASTRRAMLWHLYVGPAYRGQGIGQRLAERAIAQAKGIGLERIELDAYASNEPAIRLYEKLGFVVEGTKKKGRKLDGVYDDVFVMALIMA